MGSPVLDALRSALSLCMYLESVWPEVGFLPSVQDTKRDVLNAMNIEFPSPEKEAQS